MNKRIVAIVFLVLSTLGFKLSAQVDVKVSMDTSMLLIGDHAKLIVEANFPSGYEVLMPIFSDTVISKLEVLNIEDQDTVLTDNKVHITQIYNVTSFDSGWYTIPPKPFVVKKPKADQIDTVYSVPVYFGVMTMPLDTANPDGITDIKAPAEAPLTLKELLPYIGIGLGVLVILLLAYILYMKLARKEPIFAKKEKPKEPAHVIAFRDLDALKEQKLWQQGKVKEFYSQLTDIIRTYIDDRFGIQAMEMITDEIMEAVSKADILDMKLKNELVEILRRADFVKFAKAMTMPNENEESMKFAYEFVIKTKPVEVLVDGNNEESDTDESINNSSNKA